MAPLQAQSARGCEGAANRPRPSGCATAPTPVTAAAGSPTAAPVLRRKQQPGWTKTKAGVSLAFAQSADFKAVYQRNNKSGGLKNLRCFPTCADFHRQRGFCGRSVGVNVKIAPQPADKSGAEGDDQEGEAKVSCWGQFVPALREQVDFDPDVGDVVDAKDVDAKERTKTNMQLPLLAATPAVGQGGGDFEVNQNPKAWHYGWTASKHSCDTAHHFKVYAFRHLKDGRLECVGVVCSPSFVMFCRRRRRFALQPSAPLAPTLSPNMSANPTRPKPCASHAATSASKAPKAAIKSVGTKRAAATPASAFDSASVPAPPAASIPAASTHASTMASKRQCEQAPPVKKLKVASDTRHECEHQHKTVSFYSSDPWAPLDSVTPVPLTLADVDAFLNYDASDVEDCMNGFSHTNEPLSDPIWDETTFADVDWCL
ncbi:Hypothetical Protein FCC1311_028502 [Hondaea fermentalgiana]|uniref:Uncharacterized protein n=1 Tax=Hondaea fermentalgiana TaxID=2315210 RepID=A0A2R5G8I0_9STRA|nr:Hypothetical Protein FCC1311_028502 [Hondaea fermentalgiana]|eukprot:GBG26629.1 Hypothetical Protein FCC1311_028502 [Hondaea fermentalgiana]